MVKLMDTTKTKTRSRKVGAVVAAATSVAGMVFAAPPATATVAAYPTSTFEIVVGASYFKGTVTWYNRSVGVTGAFKATGCRRAYGQAFKGSAPLKFANTSTWCDRSGPVTLDVKTDVVGGADNIWVYMTDGNLERLEGQTCYRGASTCIDGLQ